MNKQKDSSIYKNQEQPKFGWKSSQESMFCGLPLSLVEEKNATYYGGFNNAQDKEGLGIVLYDTGEILFGQFIRNQLQGYFYFFKDDTCCYGTIISGQLCGTCYLYARNQVGVEVHFGQNKIPTLVCYNSIQKGEVVFAVHPQTNNFTLHLNNMTQFHQQNPIDHHDHKIMKPSEFISNYLLAENAQQFQTQQNSSKKIKITKIARNQIFVGSLRNNKPHGLGIILIDEWPVCCGNFEDGQLSGLGRIQQNRNLILDGVFQNSCLKLGWVINFKDNSTNLGCLIRNGDRDLISTLTRKNYDRFHFYEEHAGIDFSMALKSRRQQHIKSLNFINSYCQDMGTKIISQFPTSYFKYLRNENTNIVNTFEQSFIPSFISDIQRINGLQQRHQNGPLEIGDETNRVERDLIELIHEYDNTKNLQKGYKAKINDDKIKIQDPNKSQSVQNLNLVKSDRRMKLTDESNKNKSSFNAYKRNEVYLSSKYDEGSKKTGYENESKSMICDRKQHLSEIKKLTDKINKSPLPKKQIVVQESRNQEKKENKLNLQSLYKKHLKNTS